MGRKDIPSEREQEVEELVAQYEVMKADNKKTYMDADQLAEIANKYALDDQYDDAQEAISYGLSLHPGNTDLMIEQAYLYMDLFQTRKAIEVVENITDRLDTEVILLRAELMLYEGRPDDAAALLEKIDEEDKEDTETIIDITYMYSDMGYSKWALPWIEKGLEMEDDNEDLLMAAADCHYNGERLEKAEYYYNKLIDMDAYDPVYWMGLARCQFLGEKHDKAIESCDLALAADETYSEAHVIKGHCFAHLNNNYEAIAEYHTALEQKALTPEFAYMFIALAYSAREEWQNAIDYFDRSIEFLKVNEDLFSSMMADLYNNKAQSLAQLGRYKEAHDTYDLSLKAVPENLDTYLFEGRTYMEEGKFEEGCEKWTIALNRSPLAGTWMVIGNHCMACELMQAARFCYKQAERLDPEYPEVYERLTSICLILRDHKGFYKYNQKAKKPLDFAILSSGLSNLGKENEWLAKEFDKFVSEIKDYNEEDSEESDENECPDDKKPLKNMPNG